MPTVRTQQGPTVQEASLNTGRVSTSAPIEAFGGGSGLQDLTRSAAALPGALRDTALEAKAETDKAVVAERRTALSKIENDLLYNADSGLLNTRGENAFNIREGFNENYKKRVDEVMESLHNQEQKDMFSLMAENSLLDNERKISQHQAKELQNFKAAAYETSLQTSADNATRDIRDTEKELEISKGIIITRGIQEGWPSSKFAQELQTQASKIHASRITKELDSGNYQGAQEYFKSVKDQMSQQAIKMIKGPLEEGGFRGSAQEKTAKIITSVEDPKERLAKAREITDPKLQDEVVRRVKEINTEEKQIKKAEQDEYQVKAEGWVENNKGKDPASKMPTTLWNALTPKQRRNIERLAKNPNRESNLVLKYDLEQMAATPSLQGNFMKLNLLDYASQLSRPHFDQLSKTQAGLRNNKPSKELGLIQSQQQMIRGTLEGIGVRKGSDEEKLFYDRVEKRTRAEAENLGRELKREELQQVIDDQLAEVTIEDGGFLWFDKTTKAFQLEVEDIPNEDFLAIQSQLRSLGLKADDKTVRSVYVNTLVNGAKNANK